MLLVLALSLTLGRSAGVSGFSGKQGQTCNNCHAGGVAPTASLTGPGTLAPGASATFTLTLTGAGSRGGFNAAASAGTLMPGASTRAAGDELTHVAPVAFNAGTLAFSFTFQAPATAGRVTLFAAGNSVNFNTNNQGDRAATATLEVAVVDPNPPADGGTAGGSGAGGGSAGNGGTGGGSGGSAGAAGSGTPPPSGTGGGTAAGNDGGAPVLMGPTVVSGTGNRGPHAYSGGVVDGGCSSSAGWPWVAAAALLLLTQRRRMRPLPPPQ